MNLDQPSFIASTFLHRRWLLAILVGVVLPLYAFGWLAETIRNRGGLDCDASELKVTHQRNSSALDKMLIFATQGGDIRTVICFAAVCAMVLLVWRWQGDERFLAHSVVGAAVIVFLVTTAFCRIRPHFLGPPPSAIDLGALSWHSMGTFMLPLALALIAWPTRWRSPVIFLSALYAVSVALSRVYLGTHKTSDVLAAWVLSLAWVSGLRVFRGISFTHLTRTKKCSLFVSGILAIPVINLAGYISSDLKHDNLRVVVVNEAYRSGQMNAWHLTQTVEHFGIKSILDLRGENPTKSWHQVEITTAAKMHVDYYDRSISSGQELSLEQMDDLVALLRDAPKPVLIHCDGGADRSGLVSALYLFALGQQSPREAYKELSVWNGHVPLIRPTVLAMDNSFWRYVDNHASHCNSISP